MYLTRHQKVVAPQPALVAVYAWRQLQLLGERPSLFVAAYTCDDFYYCEILLLLNLYITTLLFI